MKFQPDVLPGANMIDRLDDDGTVRIGAALHRGALVVPWRGDVRAWAGTSWDALGVAAFEPAWFAGTSAPSAGPRPDAGSSAAPGAVDAAPLATAALAPEVIIFGSGARLRFPPPAWLASLRARRIGVETMDTRAACRTFNVLVAEGRHASLAMLPLDA